MSPTGFAIVHVALACLGAALCYFKNAKMHKTMSTAIH